MKSRTINKPNSIRKLKKTITYNKDFKTFYFPYSGLHMYNWLNKHYPTEPSYTSDHFLIKSTNYDSTRNSS